MSAAAAVPVVINGLSVSTLANSPMLSLLESAADCEGHVLVLIQLEGGNDGLNTVIPIDQYSSLSVARSGILIPENKVLPIQGNASLGLHPNPDYSHFRSTDIWLTGASSNEVLTNGWLGRYLTLDHPNFPTGYPNTQNPDPLALQVGYVVSPAFMGNNGTMGMAITNPSDFYQLITDSEITPDDSPRNHELGFLRQTARQTNAYSDRIKAAAAAANNLSPLYPAGNKLADQLKIVARLIAGGLETKLYMVNLGGFDTHSAQTDTADTTIGAHANLLKQVSEAIFAFQDDIKRLSVDNRVMGMTFSEFGRRINANGSQGTDHGTAAPMFVFGTSFPGKVIGNNPQIPANTTVNDNLPMGIDFRAVYASILKDWFCVDDVLVDTVMGDDYEYLPFTTGIWELQDQREVLVFPNPFVHSATVYFESIGEELRLEIYNAVGQRIKQIDKTYYGAGEQSIVIDGRDLRPGNYLIRLYGRNTTMTRSVVKINTN